MKTKEFIKEVKELGFIVDIDGGFINVINTDQLVLRVSKDERYLMQSSFECFLDLNEFTKADLFDFATEYSLTPVIDRVDEKRFYVKVPDSWLEDKENLGGLNSKYFYKIYKGDGIEGFVNRRNFQSEFTESEIKKYHLENFEKVEVK